MRIDGFREERQELMEGLMDQDHRLIKRFLNLDTNAYLDPREGEEGLDARTKEWLGMVASVVLRCDDCITYHMDNLITDHEASRAELLDAFNVALVVGGSITIPHIRRVWATAEEMFEAAEAEDGA